ncbi:hypothetical protein [Marinobacter salarius]|uniref:Uncharacterized protein n=1 Tax=Marinobacter salarius TaxID=1420917 RepID=A0A1W6KFG5_9GAMM|nr:hypothetical protein [Marinobacter salarius]ARM86185.1 hypothetical protein MARSALSMR5_04165 [Marinobacter salarius]
MNTRLTLAYQSESLSKTLDVILAGRITQPEVNTIADTLTMDGRLISPQVDLPSPLEEALKNGEISQYTDRDHVWTSLADWRDVTPVAEELHTTEPATTSLTPQRLVEQAATERWNLVKEQNRLDLPEFDLEKLTTEIVVDPPRQAPANQEPPVLTSYA